MVTVSCLFCYSSFRELHVCHMFIGSGLMVGPCVVDWGTCCFAPTGRCFARCCMCGMLLFSTVVIRGYAIFVCSMLRVVRVSPCWPRC